MAVRGVIPLGADALDPHVAPPALEGTGAALDAPHGVVAGEEGDLGVAQGEVALRRLRVVGDCGGREEGFAGGA